MSVIITEILHTRHQDLHIIQMVEEVVESHELFKGDALSVLIIVDLLHPPVDRGLWAFQN